MATKAEDPNLFGEGPLGQALQVVEKKVRNLEKRKVSIFGPQQKEYLVAQLFLQLTFRCTCI
jgi:hypothetical protein